MEETEGAFNRHGASQAVSPGQTILPTQVSSSAGGEQMREACREGGSWH